MVAAVFKGHKSVLSKNGQLKLVDGILLDQCPKNWKDLDVLRRNSHIPVFFLFKNFVD